MLYHVISICKAESGVLVAQHRGGGQDQGGPLLEHAIVQKASRKGSRLGDADFWAFHWFQDFWLIHIHPDLIWWFIWDLIWGKKWCLWSYDIIRCNPICMFLLIPQEIQLLHAAQERSASSQRSLAWEEWYLAEDRPQGRHPAVWGPSKYQEKPTPKSAQTCLLPLKTCSPRRRCIQIWCIPSTQTHCCGTFSPRRTWSLKYVVDFASCSCLRTVLGHHIQPPSSHLTMVTDRIMGKKNVQLRQAAPASDFSIIGFFPIRVQNIPEVIRTFFSHNSWRWPLFP